MKRMVLVGAAFMAVIPLAAAFASVSDQDVTIPPIPAVPIPAGVGNVTFSPVAMRDLDIVDARVVSVLEGSPWDLHVGVLSTGHGFYVHGSRRMSNHIPGRAADVSKIGGVAVSAANPTAREFVRWLTTLNPPPDEVGSPFAEFESVPGFFTDGDHMGHVHLGWDG
ncbi:MAG: hypothetical protein ACREKH_10290 [Candidatus Rokuibacteriota bacterium]